MYIPATEFFYILSGFGTLMLEDNMSTPNALPCVPFRFKILAHKSLIIVRFIQHTHFQKWSYDFDTLDSKVAYA